MLELAHRVVVMREGRIQGEIAGERADEEAVMRLATAEPGARVPARMRSVLGWRTRELSTVAILALEVLFFAWYLAPDGDRSHPFLNGPNALLILKYSSIYGIAAIGAAMVIISGGVDLSPGAVIALASVVLGGLFVEGGWPLGASVGDGDRRRSALRHSHVRAGRARRAAAVHRDARRDGHRARGGVHLHEARFFDVSGALPRGLAAVRRPDRLVRAGGDDRARRSCFRC